MFIHWTLEGETASFPLLSLLSDMESCNIHSRKLENEETAQLRAFNELLSDIEQHCFPYNKYLMATQEGEFYLLYLGLLIDKILLLGKASFEILETPSPPFWTSRIPVTCFIAR